MMLSQSVDNSIDLADECEFDLVDAWIGDEWVSVFHGQGQRCPGHVRLPFQLIHRQDYPVALPIGSELEWAAWVADYASPRYSINVAYQTDLPWS